MKFEELGIKREIAKALEELEITEPTNIQKEAIPLIKTGKDVVGISNTGSGKTLAFGAPILENIQPKGGIQALIIAPTRELAVQIAEEMKKFSKYLNYRFATIFGGVALDPQSEALTKAEIVVGTPGRLVDHLNRRNLDLTKIRHVVLDEADKMVDMGFIEDITVLFDYCPKEKQTLLFGATISKEIEGLKYRYMNEPQTVNTETYVKKDLLQQFYYDVKMHEKFSLLVHLLKKNEHDRAIIFCSKRSTVEVLTSNLEAQGIKVEKIHGKLSQNRRLKVFNEFKKGNPNVLVASAVAARGLDIKDVTHIFNYDLSNDPQEYIHRIGRTARAGESGKAITLLSESDHDAFRHILNNYSIDVDLLPQESFKKLPFKTQKRSGFQGRGRFPPRNNFHRRRF